MRLRLGADALGWWWWTVIAVGGTVVFARETVQLTRAAGLGGEGPAKDAGKWRLEGKEYTVQDGDVIHFRFNV